jgi:hypothetical protein
MIIEARANQLAVLTLSLAAIAFRATRNLWRCILDPGQANFGRILYPLIIRAGGFRTALLPGPQRSGQTKKVGV